jgi:hypothetical protein
MRYIYREEHKVYVDYEIELSDEDLAENGVNPFDEQQISNYIKHNFIYIQPESSEWWISAQEDSAIKKVGIRPTNDDSEQSINWII